MVNKLIEAQAKQLIESIMPIIEKAYNVDSVVVLRRLKAEALKALVDGKKSAIRDFKRFINATYLKGIASTDAELRQLLEKKLITVFNKPHKEAIRILQESSANDISAVYDSYNNSVSAYFSRVRTSLSEKLLIKDMMETQLFGKGLPSQIVGSDIVKRMKGVVSGGRVMAGQKSMSLEAYINLLVRTIGQATLSRATELRLMQNNINHVKISSHNSKDWCRQYEGKVFSLVQNDPSGFPHISMLPNSGVPFHCNCIHTEMPFIPAMHETLDEFQPSRESLTRDVKILREQDKVYRANLKKP